MAGAPVSPATLELVQSACPQAQSFTPYGATEALPVTIASTAEIRGTPVLALSGDVAADEGLAGAPHLHVGRRVEDAVDARQILREPRRRTRRRQVGGGENLVDLTFIDDCVSAHLLAAEALAARPEVGGRAFFISQGTPVKLWEWIGRVLAMHGAPPTRRRLSAGTAQLLAGVAETIWRTCGLSSDPPLTRFLAEEMSTDHYFDITAARRDLGFAPSCDVWEATDRSFGRSEPAVVERKE